MGMCHLNRIFLKNFRDWNPASCAGEVERLWACQYFWKVVVLTRTSKRARSISLSFHHRKRILCLLWYWWWFFYFVNNLTKHMSCFLSCLQRLADSSERVVRNYDDLKTESDRLETHVKQACSSWILVMLVVVILTFVWMVLFMKMFPKTWLTLGLIYSAHLSHV